LSLSIGDVGSWFLSWVVNSVRNVSKFWANWLAELLEAAFVLFPATPILVVDETVMVLFPYLS
jgi:hypothetical protein